MLLPSNADRWLVERTRRVSASEPNSKYSTLPLDELAQWQTGSRRGYSQGLGYIPRLFGLGTRVRIKTLISRLMCDRCPSRLTSHGTATHPFLAGTQADKISPCKTRRLCL